MSNTSINKSRFTKKQSQYNKQDSLYNKILISKSIPVHIGHVGNNIKETLEKIISSEIEGKCIVEGYIKPNTVNLITFSSGLVKGNNIIFETVFECYVCSPVEGMKIKCVAKHINKAGIRAELNETPSPVIIFIARDHNYNIPGFSDVKEDDTITVRIIGQRFELNDTYIAIIAELVDYDKPLSKIKESSKEEDVNVDISIEELPTIIEEKESEVPTKPNIIMNITEPSQLEEKVTENETTIKKQPKQKRILKIKKTTKI
jgi:hypothetical protein